jgi:hypothetical protein
VCNVGYWPVPPTMPLQIITILHSHYYTKYKEFLWNGECGCRASFTSIMNTGVMEWMVSHSDRSIAENKSLITRSLRRWMDFRRSGRDGREQITTLVTELHRVFEGEELRKDSKANAVNRIRKRFVDFLIICHRAGFIVRRIRMKFSTLDRADPWLKFSPCL